MVFVVSYLTGLNRSTQTELSRSSVIANVPIPVLLHVSDLPDNLKSSLRLFPDDTLLYDVIKYEVGGDQLQDDLRRLEAPKKKMANGI